MPDNCSPRFLSLEMKGKGKPVQTGDRGGRVVRDGMGDSEEVELSRVLKRCGV